jgi:hypothetical protein
VFISIHVDRTGKLIAIFGGFVILQFVFGRVYYALYRHRRGNFSFNSDILRSQAIQVEADARDNSLAIEVLQEALQQLAAGVNPSENDGRLPLPSGRRVKVTLMSGPPAGGPRGSRLEVFDSDGKKLLETGEFEPPGASVFRTNINSAHWIQSGKEWSEALTNVLENARVR